MNASDSRHVTTVGHQLTRRHAAKGLGLAGLAFAHALSARQVGSQEGTPAETGGLPPGVSLVELPLIEPFALPEEPGAVRVFWLVLEPNAAIPTHPHPFSEFAVMESGTGMFLTEEGPAAQVIRGGEEGVEATPESGPPGVELTASTGDVAIFPSGNVSDTRAGNEGATMIILEIVTADRGRSSIP